MKDLPPSFDDGDDAPLELDLPAGRLPGNRIPEPPPPAIEAPPPVVRGTPARAPSQRPVHPSPLPRSPRPAARGSFASSIGTAFIAPFMGIGVLWIPMIAVLLLAGIFVPVMRLRLLAIATMMALIATYFGKAFARGYEQEVQAPELPKISNFKDEIFYPGLALIGLTVILFAFPAFQLMRMVGSEDAEYAAPAATNAEDDEQRKERRTEYLNPNEVFLDESGKLVTPAEGDEGRLLKRSDGKWVKVYFGDGAVVYEDHAPGEIPVGTPVADTVTSAAATPKLPLGSTLLLIVAFLVPFVYWPMALAVGNVGGNVLAIFNPVRVLGAIARAGVAYLVVVFVGVALVSAPIGLMFKAGSFEQVWMLAALMLGILGYASAVQGYLMGSLAAVNADLFPELDK